MVRLQDGSDQHHSRTSSARRSSHPGQEDFELWNSTDGCGCSIEGNGPRQRITNLHNCGKPGHLMKALEAEQRRETRARARDLEVPRGPPGTQNTANCWTCGKNPGYHARACRSIATLGEDNWTWNAQQWDEQRYPRGHGPMEAMRDCTEKQWKTCVTRIQSSRDLLETRLRKRRLHWCRRTCYQLQHLWTPDTKSHAGKINRTGIQDRTVATHPQGPWDVRDGLRIGAMCDGTENPEMPGTRPPSDGPGPEDNVEAASGLDECLRDAVVREQECRGDAILEVDRELSAQAEQRAPPVLRSRLIGPTPVEREEHCRHTSRIELGIMLASLAEAAQMRNASEKGLPLVGVDYGFLRSRLAENAGYIVEAEDDGGDPPVLCGRSS